MQRIFIKYFEGKDRKLFEILVRFKPLMENTCHKKTLVYDFLKNVIVGQEAVEHKEAVVHNQGKSSLTSGKIVTII